MTDQLRMFRGDGDLEGDNPQDFINGVERSFLLRSSVSDKDKVRAFELWLKSGSIAKAWWNGLEAAEKDTWDHLRIAFEKRWPEKMTTLRTTEEQHAALATCILLEKDLGQRVKVDGVEEFAHVVWANKVERLALDLKDHGGLLIPSTRKNMPRALRLLVGTQHKTWDVFCEAIRSVSTTELDERLEHEAEQRTMQSTIARLEGLQLQHPRIIREAITPASLPPRISTAPPRFSLPPRPAAAASLPSLPRPASTGPVAAAPQYRPDSERLPDVIRLALPVHPDTPEGRAAYQSQMAAWAAESMGRAPNEFRPHPLSPGTAQILSGECWKCGHTGHLNTACPAKVQIPQMEQKWRSIAAMIKKRAEAANVNYVGAYSEQAEWGSLEEYNAYVIAEYEAGLMQGNGEGPSA